MKLGLQIPRFPRTGDVGAQLMAIGQAAESAGYASVWVMDHFFQIRSMGKVEDPMLEAYTTLGFLAASTRTVELGTLVTSAPYRHPGALIKQVTTLDVLSAGRAWLGIGAGWYEREARGLGLPFPPLRERFAQLEETLKLAQQMWRGDVSPFHGRHFQLQEPRNSPQPVSEPRPRVLIGGGGEQRTLRLVARYADACNLFARLPDWQLALKLEILQGHCEAEGRDYDSIDKTVLGSWDPVKKGAQAIVDEIGRYRELGFDMYIASLKDVETLRPIEIIGRDVAPHLD